MNNKDYLIKILSKHPVYRENPNPVNAAEALENAKEKA